MKRVKKTEQNTTHKDERRPIVTGHHGDSSELKKKKKFCIHNNPLHF